MEQNVEAGKKNAAIKMDQVDLEPGGEMKRAQDELKTLRLRNAELTGAISRYLDVTGRQVHDVKSTVSKQDQEFAQFKKTVEWIYTNNKKKGITNEKRGNTLPNLQVEARGQDMSEVSQQNWRP